MGERILTPADVRRLAARGRLRPSPRYHAYEHHIRYEDIVAGLLRCALVARDLRTDLLDKVRHGQGYIAHAPMVDGRVLRIDFDATLQADGIMLWIVTAFRVKP